MSTVFPIVPDTRYRITTAVALQTVFSVTFPFLAAEDVEVTRIGLDGIHTLLTRPANYTIAGMGDPDGGTVTLKQTVPAGTRLLFVGKAVRSRSNSVTRAGKYDSRAQDEDLDRLNLMVQELDREVERAPRVPYGESGPAVTRGAAGTLPVWDEAGNLVEGPDSAALLAVETALAVEAGRALVHGTGGSDPYAAGARRIAGLADGTLAQDAATKAQLDALEASIGAPAIEARFLALEAALELINIPGRILVLARSTAPSGTLKCNGQTIGSEGSGATARANADTWRLFEVLWNIAALGIETSGGAGSTRGADAEADFAANKRLKLPELRGEFLRFLDDGRGIDTSRALASAQADLIKQHTHPASSGSAGSHVHPQTHSDPGFAGIGNIPSASSSSADDRNINTGSAGSHSHPITVQNNTDGGAETRPRNVALLAVITL